MPKEYAFRTKSGRLTRYALAAHVDHGPFHP